MWSGASLKLTQICRFLAILKYNCKKLLTARDPLHISHLTDGGPAFRRTLVGRHKIRTQVPRYHIGEPLLSAYFCGRFFDIVGLDEGTCGRRRPVRGF